MVTRVGLLFMCLFVARAASAGTMVTWQTFGELTLAEFNGFENTGRIPNVGTPYEVAFSFDPSSATPTFGAPAGSGCNSVRVTGSLTLGGYTYGVGGSGLTHARLPGTSCSPGAPETQFALGLTSVPPDNPWPSIFAGFDVIELAYQDLLVRDAFPEAPTAVGNMLFQMHDIQGSFLLQGRGPLAALDAEQPAPVPEPATMTMFGLGLAALARARRRLQS